MKIVVEREVREGVWGPAFIEQDGTPTVFDTPDAALRAITTTEIEKTVRISVDGHPHDANRLKAVVSNFASMLNRMFRK